MHPISTRVVAANAPQTIRFIFSTCDALVDGGYP
jgi:hypothetical protein